MSRWVTFYYDAIADKCFDFRVHPNKEEATKCFKANYKSYFQIRTPFKVELPCTYGYPFRKYCGISKAQFEKEFKVKLDDVLEGKYNEARS